LKYIHAQAPTPISSAKYFQSRQGLFVGPAVIGIHAPCFKSSGFKVVSLSNPLASGAACKKNDKLFMFLNRKVPAALAGVDNIIRPIFCQPGIKALVAIINVEARRYHHGQRLAKFFFGLLQVICILFS
jgi:hypothetical protein